MGAQRKRAARARQRVGENATLFITHSSRSLPVLCESGPLKLCVSERPLQRGAIGNSRGCLALG